MTRIKKKLCVGITYFNEETLIQRCLNSIPLKYLEHESLEVIVYDDASTLEATKYINNEYLSKIKVIRSLENNGPSYARNRILKESNSTYIRYIDSDDEFGQNYFEALFDFGASWSDSKFIYINDVIIRSGRDEKKIIFDNTISIDEFRSLVINSWVPSNSVMFPSKLMMDLKGFNEQLKQAEDVDFFYKLSFSSVEVVKLDLNLVNIVNLRLNSYSSNQKLNRNQLLKVVNEHIKTYGYRQELILAKYNLSFFIAYNFSLTLGVISIWEIRNARTHLLTGISRQDKKMLKIFNPVAYIIIKTIYLKLRSLFKTKLSSAGLI